MKSLYVNGLPTNEPFHATFLVQAKDIRQKKSGDPYLSLSLADKTGDIDAKMWDNVAEILDTFDRNDFVRVKGIVQIFQNRPQLTIHKLQRADEREIDFTDYFPASLRNPEEMWAELQAIVAGLSNPHLKALIETIFAEPRVVQAYKIAPAAKAIHHAFLSGLIEHVLSMCGLARTVAAHYGNIDLDLLLAGVILHDIGKIDELTYDRGFGYSDEGQLIGHITMGIRMVEDAARKLPDFPPALRMLLEHMILSHHGQLEYGSPKLPLFAEALLLHQLDNLDSKMECMRALAERDTLVEGNWTGYSPALERAVLKKDRFLGLQTAGAAAGAIRAGTNGPVPTLPRTPGAPPHPAEPPPRATLNDLTSKFNFTRNR
jgi:3'-5' exoribonuclease